MFDRRYLIDLVERAISAAAATFASLVGSDSLQLLELPLVDAVKASAGAALLVVVKGLAARRIPAGDASPLGREPRQGRPVTLPTTSSRVRTAELHPRFRARLEAFFQHPEIAGKVKIVSGVRTIADQQRLYDLYKRGRGNLAANPHRRASRASAALITCSRTLQDAMATAWPSTFALPAEG